MRGEDVNLALQEVNVEALIKPILCFLMKHKEIDITVRGVRYRHWPSHECVGEGGLIHHEFFKISVSGRKIYSEGHHECSSRPIRKYLNLKRLFANQDRLRDIVPELVQRTTASQEDKRYREREGRSLHKEYIARQVDQARSDVGDTE